MKVYAACFAVFLSASSGLMAQSSSVDHNMAVVAPVVEGGSGGGGKTPAAQRATVAPFSRVAVGGGLSVAMGVNLAVATNVSSHINLRGVGNVFNYSVNDISTNGFDATAKLNLASAGAMVDFYPFARHGFRISPGLLFYNGNSLDGTITVQPGESFTLNDTDYFSSSSDPVKGTASVGLHSNSPTFAITTGWGNVIPRSGGHWSFPFEIGTAIIGTPDVKLVLTSGKVCDGEGNCQDVTKDPTLQADLKAQIAKYKHDLDPLKTFPILSFGISYNFKIR